MRMRNKISNKKTKCQIYDKYTNKKPDDQINEGEFSPHKT